MTESRSRVSIMRFVSVVMILLVELNFFTLIAGDNGGSDIDSKHCHANLTSLLPVPYSNMSHMICRSVWNTFVLRFSQSKDHIVTIVLSAVYTTGWIGMGFSEYRFMYGSSAMVGWIDKGGRAHIKQYFLQGLIPSKVIANKGNLQVTNVPPVIVLHGDTIYLAFQLKFEEHLTNQQIIFAFAHANPIQNRLSVHVDKTSFLLDFSAASASRIFSKVHVMKKIHGVLGVIGWGVLLPCGALIPRYYKYRDPLWYYLHTVFQFVGFLIGLAAVLAGRELYHQMHTYMPMSIHRGTGFSVFVLSILQVMAFFVQPNKDSKIRKYWNWYHLWVGRVALFVGALNIIIGIQCGALDRDGESVLMIVYWVFLAIILIAFVILEVLLRLRGRRKKPVEIPAFETNPIQ